VSQEVAEEDLPPLQLSSPKQGNESGRIRWSICLSCQLNEWNGDVSTVEVYNLPMRRLRVFILFFLAAPLLAQTANKPDTIIAQENAFWKSYGDGNAAELSKLLLPDFISVEAEIWNRDQVLTFTRKFHEHCTLVPVKVVDPHVTFLTPEIATLVYHAIETPTCGSRTLSGETNISTVWLLRDGRWQMHLHTEYAVPPK